MHPNAHCRHRSREWKRLQKKKEVKSKKKRTFKDVAICSRPSSKQEEFERHGELQSELI